MYAVNFQFSKIQVHTYIHILNLYIIIIFLQGSGSTLKDQILRKEKSTVNAKWSKISPFGFNFPNESRMNLVLNRRNNSSSDVSVINKH